MSWKTDLRMVAGDPKAAVRVLAHAAAFLRRGEALPTDLAAFLATAIENAAEQAAFDGAPPPEFGRMLIKELKLTTDRQGAPERVARDRLQQIHELAGFDESDLPVRDVVKREFKRLGYGKSRANELLAEFKQADEQRGADEVRELEQWLEHATPEQREVFDREQVQCSHDFAVFVLKNPPRLIWELADEYERMKSDR